MQAVEGVVMKERTGHYFLWFLVFGLIAGLVSFIGEKTLSSEAIWLLGSGVLGLLIAHKSVKNSGIARYFDFIIGIIFMVAGIIGIVYNFKSSLIPSAVTSSGVTAGTGQNAVLIGLSLALFPAIVHLLLGFTSFRHGLENSSSK